MFKCIVVLSLVIFSVSAHSTSGTEFDFGLSINNTDNHLFDDINKSSTTSIEFSPTINSEYKTDTQLVELDLGFNLRKFTNFSVDDSVDSTALIKYHYKFRHNQKIIFSTSFSEHHLERGQGFSKGLTLLERDEQKQRSFDIAHQLGNVDSSAILLSAVGVRDIDFTNRKDASEAFNLSASFIELDFSYKLGDRTFIISNLSAENVNYDSESQQDRIVSTALAGIRWAKTEHTNISTSFGLLKLNFDQGQLTNKVNFNWNVQSNWSPIEPLVLSVSFFRSADQSDELENSYLISDNISININYKLTDYFHLSSKIVTGKSDLFFEDRRESEDLSIYMINLLYKITPDMSVVLAYEHEKLESIDINNTYDKNTLTMEFRYVI